MRYRTEIHVADDRYVCLQLPDYIPTGRATVTVVVAAEVDRDWTEVPEDESDPGEARGPLDRLDVEWWDDFGDEATRA